MKITFEFNTQSEDFDPTELEVYKQAEYLKLAIDKIADKIRGWEKYDARDTIPKGEIFDEIWNIIDDYVDMSKLGY